MRSTFTSRQFLSIVPIALLALAPTIAAAETISNLHVKEVWSGKKGRLLFKVQEPLNTACGAVNSLVADSERVDIRTMTAILLFAQARGTRITIEYDDCKAGSGHLNVTRVASQE